MLFNSGIFIFAFLPATLVGFFLVARLGGRQPAFVWIILCSVVFYISWNPINILIISPSIFVNYLLARWLAVTPARKARYRRAIVTLGVAANLLFLGYFKYRNFFLDTANMVAGSEFRFEHIVLPLGISFITFQKIALLVDVYVGRVKQFGFLEYCLFVMFFPQLVAGPIVHYREVIPQFKRVSLQPSNLHLAVGVTLFFIGLAKKVLLADTAAAYASPVFAAAAAGHGVAPAEAWLGALAYTLQIYFDFSGYTDMALGAARCFGIRLPMNFNSPYKSLSIIEFWRRWHITLSRFLRDYLYIPLGGNRHGFYRRYVNLAITMLLGGLWHGANWTFVFWGGLHGLYLIVNHAWRSNSDRLPGARRWKATRLYGLACWLVTFLAVLFAWVFFRAPSFAAAGRFFAAMAGYGWVAGAEAVLPGLANAYVHILPLLFIALAMPNSLQLLRRYKPALGFTPEEEAQPKRRPGSANVARQPRAGAWLGALDFEGWKWRPTFAWSLAIGCIGVAGVLGLNRLSEFIYWQF